MTYKVIVLAAFIVGVLPTPSFATSQIDQFKARPPIHVFGSGTANPAGLSPMLIKAVYHLPLSGGTGTIAIIGAYDDATIEQDLGVFSQKFNLPLCTVANGCFEKHLMSSGTKSDSGWALETSLDVEWAHAIAPKAKILLVAAQTASGKNLLAAIDYAAKRSGDCAYYCDARKRYDYVTGLGSPQTVKF